MRALRKSFEGTMSMLEFMKDFESSRSSMTRTKASKIFLYVKPSLSNLNFGEVGCSLPLGNTEDSLSSDVRGATVA